MGRGKAQGSRAANLATWVALHGGGDWRVVELGSGTKQFGYELRL